MHRSPGPCISSAFAPFPCRRWQAFQRAPCVRCPAGLDAWAALDEQQDLRFMRRHQRLQLPLARVAPPSRRFRLRVVRVADPTAANSVQLACLDLFVRQAAEGQRAAEAEAEAQQPGGGRQQQQPGRDEQAIDELAALTLEGQRQQQQQQRGEGKVEPRDPPPEGEAKPQQAPPPPRPQHDAASPPSSSASAGGPGAGGPDNPWAALFGAGP